MKRLITILGPTASGKTPLAAHLAARVGGEIISADSRQVYRRMDASLERSITFSNISGTSTMPITILSVVTNNRYCAEEQDCT